jgi:hypothetical protein
MGEVYLSGVYTPPLVRQTARMGRHCRYWVSESNTPYASTDASIGGSAGFWERWSGRRMQLSSGSQAVGHGVRTGCSAAWCPGPGRGQDIGIKCATYGSLTLSRAGRRWQRGQVEEDGLAGRAGRVQVVRGGVAKAGVLLDGGCCALRRAWIGHLSQPACAPFRPRKLPCAPPRHSRSSRVIGAACNRLHSWTSPVMATKHNTRETTQYASSCGEHGRLRAAVRWTCKSVCI